MRSSVANSKKRLGNVFKRELIGGLSILAAGIYVMHGNLCGCDHGRREVDFAEVPSIHSLGDDLMLRPANRRALWDWINGDCDWTPRNGQPRIEFRRT